VNIKPLSNRPSRSLPQTLLSLNHLLTVVAGNLGKQQAVLTISGNPAAVTMLEQTLLGIVSPRIVKMGRPAQRASPDRLAQLFQVFGSLS
jgi:hypothetical protein